MAAAGGDSSSSSSGHPVVRARLPDAALFGFPPVGQPAPLAPATAPASVMRPFNVPEGVFAALLDARVPLTVAALYAVAVAGLNRRNRSRARRPWAVSRTRLFHACVVLHNLVLALYSAWTFWGMLGAVRRSFVHPLGPAGLAATADGLCHLHRPAGLGASVYYNETSSRWQSADPAVATGRPNGLSMGRIWNEGLAYYGFLFYLSKFYEVLDTFIILAKGKTSSTLQTYHHAGAMMCMWAGMRYMSAPIWTFVLVNSFIHSLMYMYYTLTAFSVRVPVALKRTLTTLQITQFLVGASYAMAHSFLTYTAPVTVTRLVPAPLEEPLAAPAVSQAPVAGGILNSIRELFLGSAAAAYISSAPAVAPAREPSLVTETMDVEQSCIVTAGETFAIWLNVLYLAPLTYLFVSFFIASYIKRSSAVHTTGGKTPRRESNVMLAEKAGWDAARCVEREVYGGENVVNDSADGLAAANGDAAVGIGPDRQRASSGGVVGFKKRTREQQS